MPTAMQKLRAFAPQIVAAAASLGAGELGYFSRAIPAMSAPAWSICVVLGGLAMATTIGKASGIFGEDDWERLCGDPKPCRHCKKLEAAYADLKRDRDELRDALVTLQLPESRS